MPLTIDKKRIFGLDLIRVIAILLVVLLHSKFLLKGTCLEGFPYFKMIDGVDIFFVLSGFLIGGILLKEINKPHGFKISGLINFWKRRWFRTLPNYYLVLLLNYIIVRYGIINEDIEQFNLNFLFFTQNFQSPFYDFFWESWSLSIEEWFYLITPLLIIIALRIFSPRRAFLLATLTMIFLPVLYRLCIYDDAIDHFWLDVTFRKTVLCRLDSIGFGLLSAWIYFYYNVLWRKIKIPSFLLAVGIIAFILNFKRGPNTVYIQVVHFSLVPISVMFILPLAESLRRFNRIGLYVIQHISKISYSMYLINLALVAEVIRDNFAPKGGTDGILKYLIYWAIVIVVSTILYRFFEKPIMDLRDRKINFDWLRKK